VVLTGGKWVDAEVTARELDAAAAVAVGSKLRLLRHNLAE
jgi:hypothetical protein